MCLAVVGHERACGRHKREPARPRAGAQLVSELDPCHAPLIGAQPAAPQAAPDSTVKIRPYREWDQVEVVQLLRRAFGKWPVGIQEDDAIAFFRWKHLANPYGESLMMVAEAGGELVGFAAWLRWSMTANARTFEALRSVDVAVHHSYRGRGVLTALVRQATTHFPENTAFTLSSPNELSRPGSLRVGGREVGVFPLFVRVRAPLRVVARLIRERHSENVRSCSPTVDAEFAADALRDRESVSALLSQVERVNDHFTTAKTADYLAWRYGALRAYHAISVRGDGRLAGIVIFRMRPRGSSWVSIVCEVLVAPGAHAVARRLLRRVVGAAPSDYVICHFPPGSTARQAAVQCGFLRVRAGPAPTVRALAKGIIPDPTLRASWAICLGDLDLL